MYWQQSPSRLYNTIEKKEIGMPDLVPMPSCHQDAPQVYDPAQQAYQLGEPCGSCGKNITYHESITACNCHKFSHRKCLIERLNKANPNQEQWKYECKVCKASLKVFYAVEIKPQCRFRLINLIEFLITALVLAAYMFYVLTEEVGETILSLAITCIILSILYSLFFVFLGNLIFVRNNILDMIASTNLELVVSAFMGMETLGPEEEDTQTDMIRY